MGYTTTFDGRVAVRPPLNRVEIEFLEGFSGTRRVDRESGPYYVGGTRYPWQGGDPDVRDFGRPPVGQPGLWCRWVPTADGAGIEWDGGEKFYDATAWMRYLIDHFLRAGATAEGLPGFEGFTFDHVLDGTVEAQGEEDLDRWQLVVVGNEVSDTQLAVEELIPVRWVCDGCLGEVDGPGAVCCPGEETTAISGE